MKDAPPADWVVPQWPAPAHVRALCTTRSGGMSDGPYASLNLGDHVGDAAQQVARNREVLAQATQAHMVYLSQVHGTDWLELRADTPQAQAADGSWTTQAQVACTVMMADCLPVLLTDLAGTFVAAAHAGWRGLAGTAQTGHHGVLETFFMQNGPLSLTSYDNVASNIIAWLGPCIGPDAFEVSEPVRAEFMAQDRQAEALFVPRAQNGTAPDKWLANLAGLARQRLQALGVRHIFGNDGTSPWCTFSQAQRYFSHRREGAIHPTGRMAASIWRV